MLARHSFRSFATHLTTPARLCSNCTMAAVTASRKQPPWTPPPRPSDSSILPPLKIYNSLTRSKNDFVPLDPAGKKVTWYACGPTVYDVSHLGHARNYVSTDIIRRILKDYFEFNVQFVMNITDVDDKIILRGRQQHFFAKFVAEHPSLDESVLAEAQSAFTAYLKKNLPLLPEKITPEAYAAASDAYEAVKSGKSLTGDDTPPGDAEAKLKMHLKTAQAAADALQRAQLHTHKVDIKQFYNDTEDVFLPYLDSLYGSTIDASDHSMFTKLTKHYEDLFFEDMRNLNVLDPDTITRVTEFGPQIVSFVERIVKNGFAYASEDGSVYFDINSFEAAGNPYARLEPWNTGNQALQADGEGALAKKSANKKSDADFALWKSSKAGEPAWPSPWGPGRPGWHIECSVMASETLGKQMDIHSGGIDLAFPHHDNELAQSEAYWISEGDGCKGHSHEWVKYFLHMGHLSISGAKMSKSLKNFTSIRKALSPPPGGGYAAWTRRGLRIVFLLGGWKEGVEITEDLVKAGRSWEEKLQNFFLKAADIRRNESTQSKAVRSAELQKAFTEARSSLHEALCDSFNTPQAMQTISQLITDANTLISSEVDADTTIEIAQWLTKIVTIFGLNGQADLGDSTTLGWEGVEIPAAAQPFVYGVSQLRDEVRRQARSTDLSYERVAELASEAQVPATTTGSEAYATVFSQFRDDIKRTAEAKAPAKELLQLCDDLRDTHLWYLDIYLEDRDAPLPAMVRPLDASLKQARADKEQRDREKREAKIRREQEEAEKKRQKDEAAKVDPKVMFRTDEYGEWDAEGVPVKDAKGEELSKARRKKLLKEYENQKKNHEKWLQSQSSKS